MKEALEPIMKLAGKLRPRHDDDFVDRLHYLLTPSILTGLALVIACKQFVGKPIQCWAQNEVARQGAWMAYAENYCFAENTYFVSMDERFPMPAVERDRREIHYYQWVAFILIGQALLLLAPKLVWNAFSWRSGFNVRSLIQHAQELSAKGELEGKEQASRDLGERIGKGIVHNQRRRMRAADNGANKNQKLPEYPDYGGGPTPAAFFVTFHLITLKALNLLVVLFQLGFLTKLLGNPDDTEYWGFAVARNLLAGRDWRESGAFPRVTFCDVPIRQDTSGMPPRRYSFQCVLMINMVNEKFFLFIWFWLLGLAIVGILNLFIWIQRVLSPASADQFVLGQLRFATAKLPSRNNLRLFVRRGLSHDGVTVLRLIAMNCDPTVSAMLVLHLWRRFYHAMRAGQLKSALGGNNPPNLEEAKQQQMVAIRNEDEQQEEGEEGA